MRPWQLDSLRDDFYRETYGLREALKASQYERERLLHRVDKYGAELKILRERTEKDQETKTDLNDMNDALTNGLNHSKFLNKEAEALFQEKIRLEHELSEAKAKVNMLLIKTDGGCQKSEWDAWCKRCVCLTASAHSIPQTRILSPCLRPLAVSSYGGPPSRGGRPSPAHHTAHVPRQRQALGCQAVTGWPYPIQGWRMCRCAAAGTTLWSQTTGSWGASTNSSSASTLANRVTSNVPDRLSVSLPLVVPPAGLIRA